MGLSTKVSKNQVVCARCHLVGLTLGIVCTTQSSAASVLQIVSVNARVWR